MKIAHFFDIDTILVVDNKVWIVDKTNPNIPIMKLSQSDFNLIKSGIYKNQNNKIEFSEKSYYLPKDMMENLKIKCKNNKTNISNLAFSMQEFMNKDLIKDINYDININNIFHIKDTNDDIYFICSKNNKINYELMIKKIEDKLKQNGLVIKNFYFISETFYNRNEDEIAHKKVRLLLQHLIGFKTDGDRFIDTEVEKYDDVRFYDDDVKSINLSINCNGLMQLLISNTEQGVKLKIKDVLKGDNVLTINMVTPNKVNRFKTTKVNLEWSNLIKAFESFRNHFTKLK
jgi:hypothetical protein